MRTVEKALQNPQTAHKIGVEAVKPQTYNRPPLYHTRVRPCDHRGTELRNVPLMLVLLLTYVAMSTTSRHLNYCLSRLQERSGRLRLTGISRRSTVEHVQLSGTVR